MKFSGITASLIFLIILLLIIIYISGNRKVIRSINIDNSENANYERKLQKVSDMKSKKVKAPKPKSNSLGSDCAPCNGAVIRDNVSSVLPNHILADSAGYNIPTSTYCDFPTASKIGKLDKPYAAAYTLDVYTPTKTQPAYEIRLLSRHGCGKHKLNMIFNQIAKQYTANPPPEGCTIKFTTEIVDDTLPTNLYGFPKLIKIRRDGQILEYDGQTNYGEIYDWIMNESLLF